MRSARRDDLWFFQIRQVGPARRCLPAIPIVIAEPPKFSRLDRENETSSMPLRGQRRRLPVASNDSTPNVGTIPGTLPFQNRTRQGIPTCPEIISRALLKLPHVRVVLPDPSAHLLCRKSARFRNRTTRSPETFEEKKEQSLFLVYRQGVCCRFDFLK